MEWERQQATRRRREEDGVEKERQEYAAVDWHDFSVVETIDYQPWETSSFPPPTTPAEVRMIPNCLYQKYTCVLR